MSLRRLCLLALIPTLLVLGSHIVLQGLPCASAWPWPWFSNVPWII
ncbi:MAG: hypothetical protein HN956_03905 [Rhodospirillaceae bacterium]|mgnify:CR=1 FL=1|nr:hypothetical protein [Rhodospirillaceae bacterium]